MKMKQMAKQSLCFLLSAGMVMNSGMMFNPPAYAAADSNVHEITVDGDVIDPVNTFRGFGAVTCNNTSRLLMDYKEEHPDKYWEMMELLFNPEKGAGLNHIKVEMGGDVNSSSGTEPATMRSPEEEANVLRGAGWHFAADAKTINPDITVEILRWGEPKWTQEGIGYETSENPKYEARYQWYKKTIDAVYDEYGYEINYVSPGQNERRRDYGDNTAWIKYCANRLNEDAEKEDARYDYSQIQIVAADTHSNSKDIAGRMLSDSELMDLVDVVSDHYTLYGNSDLTKVNQEYGKEIWYSEAIAPMINAKYRINVDPDRGGVGGKVGMADLATRFINSYSYSDAGDNPARMTRFEFQPAIGAFYEGSAYSPKQLIGAFDPWSGYYDADGGLQMVGHFMEFADLGWNYLPDACYGDGSYSDGGVLADTGTNNYLTLKDPDTDDYSMIFANNTSQTRKYKVTVKNLKKASSPLNVWETRGPDEGQEYDSNWMQMVDSFTPNKESYGVYSFTLTVKPYSIKTVTSLLDRGQEYSPGQNDPNVDRDVLALPYTDDFEYADYDTDEKGRTYLERRGGTPRYTTDQYGAFEVREGSFGNHVLTQMINYDNRPYDWNVWGNGTDENSQTTGRPRTVLGDHRWTNYTAGIDFKLDLTSPECFENYAGIGVREVVHEGTNANDIATYTFQVFQNGSYQLSCRTGKSVKGTLENFDSTVWHNMQLSADENVLTAYVDGKKAAELVDDNHTSMSGRVTLTSGFYNTQFDNLEVLPIEGKVAAAEQKLDDTSELITWNGNWNHVLNEGYGHYNRTRTYGGSIEKGVYAHNSGQIRYYKGGNPLAWGSNDSNAWGSAADEAHYEFDFYGTGIEIFGEANGSNGTGDVYVDEEKVGTVNYNSGNGGTGHNVFNLDLDPDQLHTLKVTATSSFISLQKLKVIGEPDDSGESRENSFSLTFHGTGIQVFGNSGAATIKVEVDGEIREAAYQTPAAGNRQTTYALQNLPEGAHTVKITVEGGTYYVDGIDVLGTAAEGAAVNTAKLLTLIDTAKKLTNDDETYMPEDWENFQKAIAAAEEALAGGSAEAVNQAYLALRNAMEKLGLAGAITEVTGLEKLYITTKGTVPKMPDRVSIIRLDGKASEADVVWNLSEEQFDTVYKTVEVTGEAGEDKYPVKARVMTVPQELRYYIDCAADVPVNPNGGGALEIRSSVYEAVKKYFEAGGVVCSKRLLNQAVRKSLRTHNLKPKKGAQVMRKNEKITALYERLSRDDFGKDDDQQRESNSISNQKAMLEEFAARQGFTNIVHFTDDGISGTCFDRPGFLAMMKEVEAGNVEYLCIKDMSRMGRDYLKVGQIMEILRQRGVRLIAINDGVDSARGDDDFTPFRNIMNEYYARDTSRKIRSTFQSKGKSGKHLTGTVIYGYLWNEARDQWLVDPEAAEVVKRIFAMTIDGYGPYQIASKLKSEKVLIPSAYLAQHGEGVNKNKTFKDVYGWGSSTICNILEKREYLGHTINFKTRKHFKDKKSHYVPEDEWTIFENTHEAIIDQQTFDLVQKIRGNVRRYPDGWGEAAPLTGLLYCADCGGKMYVHRTNNGKRISQYTCSQYSKVPVGKLCTTQHRINEDVVLSLVSEMLKAIAEYAKHDRAEFVRVVQEAQSSQQTAEVRKQRTRLATAKQRVSELEVLLCKIYEDNILGKLSDSRYATLDAQYEKEQSELTAEISALEKAIRSYEKHEKDADRFIALIDKYENFDKLTIAMLNEFIEKILVHERDRKGSIQTTQEVEIYFNFVGRFVPPAFGEAELTPEELEEIRKREERKDRLHQNYLKRKASGAQKRYEDKIKGRKKAEIEAKKAAIRAEDIAKGVFVPVSSLPQREPMKGVQTA